MKYCCSLADCHESRIKIINLIKVTNIILLSRSHFHFFAVTSFLSKEEVKINLEQFFLFKNVCKRRMRKVIFPSECNFLSFSFFLYDRYWKELCESFYKFPFIFSSLLSVICNSSSTSCQFFAYISHCCCLLLLSN